MSLVSQVFQRCRASTAPPRTFPFERTSSRLEGGRIRQGRDRYSGPSPLAGAKHISGRSDRVDHLNSSTLGVAEHLRGADRRHRQHVDLHVELRRQVGFDLVAAEVGQDLPRRGRIVPRLGVEGADQGEQSLVAQGVGALGARVVSSSR